MKKIFLLLLSWIILFSFACREEEMPTPVISAANGFYVVNEGGFNHGNASLGYYDIKDKTYTDKLFKNANQRVMGDIFQAFYIYGDRAYCVLNNSGYIEVIDTGTYVQIDRISGFNAPRNMLFMNESKAYVSDLYANSIQVVNLPMGTIDKTIPIPSWTENMILANNRVFVAAPWDIRERIKNQIYVIDPQTDVLMDSITVGYDPVSIELDKNDKLWVYCRGAEGENAPGGIYRINTQNLSVETAMLFDDYEAGITSTLAINGTKDTLYYLKKDVFQLPISAAVLPPDAIISSDEKNLYSLDINPQNGAIIITDAGDFVQKGQVFIYDSNGHLVDDFRAGVIPSGVVF